MKVLHIGKSYPLDGGVEKVMYEIVQGVSERNIYCDMLCAAGEKAGIVTLNEYARIFCAKSYGKFAATFISPEMIWQLKRISNNYDIVHVHHPDPMACLAMFLSGYKGKVILHWHSDILKQKTLLKLYKPLQNWLINRADAIVGTTPVYVQQSPCLQQVQHKIDYIPIGVEPITPSEQQVQEIRSKYAGKKIVYSLGRLVEYKGYEYLIEAANYLNDDFVILIGSNGHLKEKLQKQINDNGLQDKVYLLGRIPEDDMPAYFGACDVFCLSSVWKTEAFAIVQIEAMSCGKPVVATKIPESGVSWVNKDGYSGLNVEIKNGKALAEAIMKITSDTENYKRYCIQAKERYETCFTRSKMTDRCLSLYNQVLK